MWLSPIGVKEFTGCYQVIEAIAIEVNHAESIIRSVWHPLAKNDNITTTSTTSACCKAKARGSANKPKKTHFESCPRTATIFFNMGADTPVSNR